MDDTIIQTKPSRRTKYAIFDFDWTLVKPQEGRKFPKEVTDWQYLRPSVPEVLQKYGKTHHVVIVTDQSKPWKIDQIKAALSPLQIEHLTVVIGVQTQKPQTALFHKALPKFKPDNAFYVGDAAGRPGDWSDKDKVFAQNINVTFYTPEEIFPLAKQVQPKAITKPPTKEVIIMIGYPGSGKSTIAKQYEKAGYTVISGDEYKTGPAMIKAATATAAATSIVFDSTAGTKEKRHMFVKFAQENNMPVTAIWVQTSIDESMERNKQRAASTGVKPVPAVAFYLYRKHFEEPLEAEGFSLKKVA
jgi:bifunctional polynucleotide phosphatase/kinase